MVENFTLDKFGARFQEAMIGHMLNENWFCTKSLNLLKGVWFTDSNLGVIFEDMQSFHSEFKRTPTALELQDYVRNKRFTKHKDLQTKIDQCVASSQNLARDYVSEVATGWLKMCKFKNYMNEASRMFNDDKGIETINWVDQKIAEIKACTFLHDEAFDFSNPLDFYRDFNIEATECLTIGHPDFDELISPGSKLLKTSPLPENIFGKRRFTLQSKGSLAKGDTTMIIGPSNSGKTTAVISVLVANVLSQKYCLLVTHEQNARDIADKIFQCYFQLTRQELMNPSEQQSKLMINLSKALDDYLVYVPWVKSGSMYVEDVIDMIREKNSFQKTINKKGFDLVIDDYPGKLSSRNASKNSQDHTLKTYIYDQFVTLAIEEQFHMLTPLQANRGGFQKAKNLKEGSAMIDQADVADAYNIVQRASNIITLNANTKDKELQVTRFLLAKSRSSQTGKVFVSKTNHGVSTTHSMLNHCLVYSESNPMPDTSIYNALGMGLAGASVKATETIETTETQENKEGKLRDFFIPTVSPGQ